MSIRVRLSPLLRKYVPGYNHDEGLVLDYVEGESVRQLIKRLGIPPEEVFTIIVNHYPGQPSSVVKDGDSLMLTKIIAGG